MKQCEICGTDISVYSRFCQEHAAEARKERDRARKRQQRQDGRAYAAVKEAQGKQRETKRKFICDYLSSNPCVDCGESDILVLEFDHRPKHTKLAEISAMISGTRSLKALKEEVTKCDVRCANCHKRMTYARFGDTYRTKYIALVAQGIELAPPTR
jgi:sRNA-binding protein